MSVQYYNKFSNFDITSLTIFSNYTKIKALILYKFIINFNYMFGNEKGSKEIETIIGPSVKVEGNFVGEGNVVVAGMVNGSLKTNHSLKVEKEAKIKAEVETANLYLAGEIRGNVKVKEKTVMTATAKIIGNLETQVLSVEAGAIINGKCLMLQSEKQVIENKENKKNNKQLV